jgi:dihydroorotase
MRPVRMALCLHGEMPGVYCIEREIAFLKVVYAVLRDFPGMPVTLEHITTKEAVQFVRAMAAQGHRIAASITPHHLLRTLDDVVGSTVNVHEHCQPVPKGPKDREALIEAATSGDACFFLGTDSAPHAKDAKECAEGCAGVYNAPCALETVAEVFEARGALDHRFDRFVSLNGARHYSLPPNMDKIVLVRRPWRVPKRIGNVIPWRAGETIAWQVEGR